MGNWVTALGIPEVIEGLLCCTSSALSAACSKCSIGHPRFVFSLFLFCATVASFLVLSPNMRPLLDKIPYFCTAVTTNEMCDSLVGYGAVYRICFSLVIFHAVFAILMLNTTSTNDIRFKLHNGYWFLKLVLLVLISMGAFHIPKYTEFGRIWMYAGLTGGFMFIMIQIMLIIDFAHSWSISWAEKVDAGNTNFWYIALALFTIIIYSVAITMAVFFYLYFTDLRNLTKCRGNLFLITFNLSQCFLASFISVLPQVQDESYGSGLLQSSIVTLYVMYLTWCTLSSEPDASCNPLGDVILEYDKATGVNGQALFDCVLMFALLLFACNVRTSTSKLEKLGFSLSKLTVAKKYEYIDTFDESSLKSREKNDEDEFVEYNYSYFHFVMLLASLQLMMVVTNWHSPHEMADMKKLVKNWATVWIQLSASFLCMLFYIWAMVAPLLIKTWGPCLGLDYERVPTDDDYEYGRSRRRTDAIFTQDDVMEKLESGKNFRKVDKSRQTTMDSGMFDTNATTTRSLSRASLRPSSSKSIRSDVHEPKFAVALENTGDMGQTMLDNRLIANEQNQTSDGLGREILERPQSRQSAVDEGNGDAVLLKSSQSSLINKTTKNEKSLNVSPRKQTKISSTEIKDIVIDLSEKDETLSRPLSRIVVNDRASEDEDSNRLPITNEGILVMSTGEANEGLRTLSRSDTKDLSREEKEIGITRKTSSEQKDDIDTDRKISLDEQSPCSGAGVEESQSRLSDQEQNGQTTPRSGRSSPRSGRSSPRNGRSSPRNGRSSQRSDRMTPRSDRTTPKSGRTTPRSDRPIPRDKMTEAPRPCSRGVTTTEVKNESSKSSAQELVNPRTTSSRHAGNDRVSSDKSRPIFLQMEDHVGWVKRIRKSKNNLNDDTSLENRQLKTKIDQLTSTTNNDKTNVRNLKEEKSIKTLDKSKEVLTNELPFHKEKARVDKSLESVKINRQKDKTSHTEDDSASIRPPLNVQPVTNSFTNSLQQPNVSKEILRLQAKILKFQAKVVKTQQQILNMQDNEKRRQSPQTENPT